MRQLCKQLIRENADLKFEILKRDVDELPVMVRMAPLVGGVVKIANETRVRYLKLGIKKPDG